MTGIRRYSPDGGPIPNNVRASQRQSGSDAHGSQFGLQRGYVQKAVFPDDDENITGDMEYHVTIKGQLYAGVLDMSSAGSIFNSHLRVRRGVGRDKTSPDGLADETLEEKKDGEAVWCLFAGGDGDVPIIVRSATHPRAAENPNYIKPTAALGEFERYEQNGFEFLITADGELSITMVGLADPTTGLPKDPTVVGTVAKFSKDGGFAFMNAKGTTFEVSQADDSITMQSAFGDKLAISAADGIQASTPAGGGTSISMKGGKLDVLSAQDLTVTSQAAGVTVVGAGGATLKLAAGKVGLGSGANEVLDILNQLITALSTCTAPGFGAPISIVAQMTPLLTKMAALMGGI